MPTIDELTNKQAYTLADEETGTEFEIPVGQPEPVRRGIDLSFLKTETGEGEISEYISHPLNFNQSKGMAQMLRGFTGMFGSLKLAVIDIFLGALNFSKERKAAINVQSIRGDQQ
jgi:hypothetical protein